MIGAAILASFFECGRSSKRGATFSEIYTELRHNAISQPQVEAHALRGRLQDRAFNAAVSSSVVKGVTQKCFSESASLVLRKRSERIDACRASCDYNCYEPDRFSLKISNPTI